MHARRRVTVTVAALSIAAIAVGVTVGSGVAGAQTARQVSQAASSRAPRTITVTGTGMVRGTPDVLQLTMGVDSHAKSAGEALSRNSSAARRVISVLRGAGVAAADIQTSSLSLSPLYDDTGNTVIGYAVSNQVTASIHDIASAGRVVDSAARVAGNEIVVNGLFFTFDDDTKIVKQARTDAVRRARSQATQLTDAAGVHLGNLLSLTEDSTPQGPVVPETFKASADAGSAPPIQTGSQTLSVQVTLIYEIN
jgi:uncharacterized protein YggE